MKSPLVCAALAVSLLSVAAERAAAEGVFPDKNLEAVVRQYVFEKRNNEEPIVEDDVVNISTIVGKGKGIKDLTGLEKCRSLALLDLEGNEIERLVIMISGSEIRPDHLSLPNGSGLEGQLDQPVSIQATPRLDTMVKGARRPRAARPGRLQKRIGAS